MENAEMLGSIRKWLRAFVISWFVILGLGLIGIVVIAVQVGGSDGDAADANVTPREAAETLSESLGRDEGSLCHANHVSWPDFYECDGDRK